MCACSAGAWRGYTRGVSCEGRGNARTLHASAAVSNHSLPRHPSPPHMHTHRSSRLSAMPVSVTYMGRP